MAQELLTAEELAGRLKIRPDTVKTWARQGRIPAMRLSPKVLRFDFDDVRESLSKPTNDAGGRRED